MVGANANRGFANLFAFVQNNLKKGLRHTPLEFVMDLVRPLNDMVPRDDMLSIPVIRQQKDVLRQTEDARPRSEKFVQPDAELRVIPFKHSQSASLQEIGPLLVHISSALSSHRKSRVFTLISSIWP